MLGKFLEFSVTNCQTQNTCENDTLSKLDIMQQIFSYAVETEHIRMNLTQ